MINYALVVTDTVTNRALMVTDTVTNSALIVTHTVTKGDTHSDKQYLNYL